jgi:hypothetical protein
MRCRGGDVVAQFDGTACPTTWQPVRPLRQSAIAVNVTSTTVLDGEPKSRLGHNSAFAPRCGY